MGERLTEDDKFDFRIPLLHWHRENVHILVQSGYYSKVKHLIERYEKDDEYLVNVEIFSKLIILQRVSPVDGFKTILQDKIEF